MKKKSLFITLPLALFLFTEANAQLSGVLVKDAASASPTAAQKRLHIDAATGLTPAGTTMEGILFTNGYSGTGTTANDGLIIGVGNYSLANSSNSQARVYTANNNSYSILNRENTSLILGAGSNQNAMIIRNDGRVGISFNGSFLSLSSTSAYTGALTTSNSATAKTPFLTAANARLTVKDSASVGLLSQTVVSPAAYLINNGPNATLIAQNLGNNGIAARFINAGGATGTSTTVFVQNRAHLTGTGIATGVFYQGVNNTQNQIAFRAEMSGNNNYGYFAYLSGDQTTVPVSGQKSFSSAGTGYGNRNNPFQGETFASGLTSGVAHVGLMGHVFPPSGGLTDAHAFGVYGDASQDGVSISTMAAAGSRIGGVLGRVYDGDISGTKSFTYGILAYRDGLATSWGAYVINNSAGDGTLTERLSGTSSEGYNKVGIGAFASVTGAIFKGGYYGMSVKGNRFAVYADGKTITNDVIAQVTNTNGTERVATYVPTSTTVDVSSRGVSQLVNGSTFVNFDANYTQLVEEGSIMVTVTPNGASAGVYVTEVTSKGFRVIENGNGTSNVAFTWRADAVKKGMNGMTLPEEVLSNEYDTNMRKTMITDMDANQSERKSMSIVNGKLTFKDASQAPVKTEQPTKGE